MSTPAAAAAASELLTSTDNFIFDCDGVLYNPEGPVQGAAKALASLRTAGKRCFFVTNNSQYSEAEFATKFERLGFGEFVGPGALWTSVGACEHYLRQLEPANGRRGAFVVGSEGLKDAVSTAGYTLVRRDGPANAEERCYSPEEMGHVEVIDALCAAAHKRRRIGGEACLQRLEGRH